MEKKYIIKGVFKFFCAIFKLLWNILLNKYFRYIPRGRKN